MSLRSFVRSKVKRSFVTGKRVVSGHEIARYLNSTTTPRLNIGAGGNRVSGWLNLDLEPAPGVVFMDASERWPFADGSIDAIMCEHMIEHLPKEVGLHLLREMRRTLRPGGWLRVVTPDLTWLASRILTPAATTDGEADYLNFINGFMKRSKTTWCDAVNLCFYEHGHRYIWSIDELKAEIAGYGFCDLIVTRAAAPHHELFRGVEGHPRLIGEAIDALEAFAVEARAPS